MSSMEVIKRVLSTFPSPSITTLHVDPDLENPELKNSLMR